MLVHVLFEGEGDCKFSLKLQILPKKNTRGFTPDRAAGIWLFAIESKRVSLHVVSGLFG